MTIKDELQAEVEKKRQELEDAVAKLEAAENKPLDIQFAEDLHKKMCHWNHTDGCGWYYRKDDWRDSTHVEYLNKARKILEFTDYETAMKVIEIAR